MRFANEKEFEEHLRKDILVPMLKKHPEYYLMESKKAVDILICKNGKNSALFFIEVKYHRYNHGRLGFGHAKGGGFQPELLMHKPSYFHSNMRWILGVEDKDGYLFMTNDEIVKSVSSGKVEKKYNNIQTKIFNERKLLSSSKLKAEISKWLGLK
jgi:hypothetical protein